MFNLLYDIFGVPFGYLMRWIYNLVNNYGVAIILFTLITKILLLPLNYKMQKNSARMRLLNPKLAKLRKSYQNNPQKLQEEQMKLYQEEGVNPMGSCTTPFIQMFLLFGVLDVVYRPLTHILDFGKDVIGNARDIASGLLKDAGGKVIETGDLRRELITIEQFENHTDKFSEIGAEFTSKVTEFCDNFQLFGINLGATPTMNPEVWNSESIGLFMIPILAGITQLLSTIYTQVYSKKKNPDAPSMGGCMNVMLYGMPIFSIWLAFSVPAGVGFYWICSTIFSFLVTFALNCYFSDARIEAIVAKDKEKAKKYAEVNGGKKTFMQKMLEQQQAMQAEEIERRNTVYDENGKKLSRSEINNYNRQLINDAREKMSKKYSESKFTTEEEKIIDEARKRIAEKYGDNYEN